MYRSFKKHVLFTLILCLSVGFLCAGNQKKINQEKYIKEPIEFIPPEIELSPRTNVFQLKLSKIFDLDTLEMAPNNNISMVLELEKLLKKDSLMTMELKTKLEPLKVKETRSDDNRIRIFSWRDYYQKDGTWLYVIQFKIAPNRTRVVSFRHKWSNYELRRIDIQAIHTFGKGVYLVEGKAREGKELTFIGLDISTNMLRRAYLNGKDDSDATFKTTREEFEKLYYNGAYLAPKEVHITDSLFRGKILRAYYFDSRNLYKTKSVAPDGKVTFITTLHDSRQEGTADLLSKTDVNIANKGKNHKFKVKNFDSQFMIEGFDIFSSFRMDSSIYSDSTAVDYPTVRLVCGKDKGHPYEWLIYTVCYLDRSPTTDDFDQIRWAVELEGKIEELNPEEHFGSQIRLQMREEWLGKTINVIPYLGEMDPTIGCATSVEDVEIGVY